MSQDRRLSSTSRRSSSVPNTSPDTSPERVSALDSDIWADEEDDPAGPAQAEILSDLPTVKRHHMTDGYREGLSVGKAKVMQQGFDEGYPIGIQIGLRVGTVLGVLEGYLACKSVQSIPGIKELVQKTYEQAKAELAITQMLKPVNEETLLLVKTIPTVILQTLERWEGIVLEVYQTQEETRRKLHEDNRGALRDLIEDR